MDISIIGENSIRLKGKLATFIVDPSSDMPKTSADAIILLNNISSIDTSRVVDSRITIAGSGEYEIGGTKISAVSAPNGILYKFFIDNISIILGRTAEFKAEGFSACQVRVINADSEFNESFVTALEPKITVLYGSRKQEAAKTLGAENVSPISKITVTKDKLPEKMEIIVLVSS